MSITLYDRQLALEEQSVMDGVVKYRERTIKAREKGIETTVDYGKQLLARCIGPLSAGITGFVFKSLTGKAGRRHLAVKYLYNLDPDVSAFIASQAILGEISTRRNIQRVALNIGTNMEDEVRFGQLEDHEGGLLYQTVMNNLKNHEKGYQDRVRRTMLNHVIRKNRLDAVVEWPLQDRVQLGLKLIDLFIETVGLVEVRMEEEIQGKGRKTSLRLSATPELMQWIVRYKENAEMLYPRFRPMVCPPRDWTNPVDGGYLTPRLQRPLIKTRLRGFAKESRTREMPIVLGACNTLQAVAWRVNARVLQTVDQVWDAGLAVNGMPSQFDTPLPPKPDYITHPEAWKSWKQESRDIYHTNEKNKSKRLQAGAIRYLAEKFAGESAFYFPVQLDFRGRVYFQPQHLNPQGCDLSKGLLTFAQGRALGPAGVRWLAIHVCNTFGNDKVDMADRVKWTVDNSARIASVAADPMSDLWWTEADGGKKPWQFLAACFEWAGFVAEGEGYVSSLPIMVDGSCNGLQHFSAMLRDEVCGKHVNLIPTPTPSDIYQVVADDVMDTLKSVSHEETHKDMAAKWAEFGIDRKATKRPVMVLPYGGSRDAVKKYLYEHLRERGNIPFQPGKAMSKAVNYLTDTVWASMSRVVVGPRKAMDWLRKASQTVCKQGEPINWHTPSGFWCQQAYPNTSHRRVETKIGQKVMKVSLATDIGGLDRRKNSQAVAPNFVHSLDAAALALTIVAAREEGVFNFAAVHDSYGTLAAHMDTLSACLRRVFVKVYSEDVLAEFAREISKTLPDGTTLAELPVKGDLKLEAVMDSEFFFA